MPKSTNVQQLYAQQGDQLFAELYADHRDAFVHWARKSFSCETEEGLEAFQEAMVLLFNKISTLQLVEIQSTLKTYLFGIGRNVLLRRFDENKRTHLLGEVLPEIKIEPILPVELNGRQEEMLKAFQQLREGCQRLLKLFYYRNFAIDAIMHEMNYQSETVVRTKKYKCLNQLKKIMSQTPNMNS